MFVCLSLKRLRRSFPPHYIKDASAATHFIEFIYLNTAITDENYSVHHEAQECQVKAFLSHVCFPCSRFTLWDADRH